MIKNKFVPLYNSIRDGIIPILEEQKRGVGILIEELLKEADRLGIETHESDIEPLFNGLSTYFRNFGITTQKSETVPSGEMVIHFKKASEEEIKFGMYLEVYKVLGDILDNYRQKLPYVIPESKFPGAYKALEETFEEILAGKKPFVIYTSDLLKYAETLMTKELKGTTNSEFFLEGLQWYLDDIGISMEISPLISAEKGDLIVDVLVFQIS